MGDFGDIAADLLFVRLVAREVPEDVALMITDATSRVHPVPFPVEPLADPRTASRLARQFLDLESHTLDERCRSVYDHPLSALVSMLDSDIELGVGEPGRRERQVG